MRDLKNEVKSQKGSSDGGAAFRLGMFNTRNLSISSASAKWPRLAPKNRASLRHPAKRGLEWATRRFLHANLKYV
jgi:hypothetical protein